MGLFVLDTSKEQNSESKIKTAIQNIELHKKLYGTSYLIDDFVLVYLNQALKQLEKN